MNKALSFLAAQHADYQRRADALNEAICELVEKGLVLERELEELTQIWTRVPSHVKEAFELDAWDLNEEEEDLYKPLWAEIMRVSSELEVTRIERDSLAPRFKIALDFLEFCREAGL